jgi:hypothetical protein
MSTLSTEAMSHSSTNIGPCPKESIPQAKLVSDTEKDVAKSEFLERISAGIAGQQLFQRIFARKSGSKGGGSTTSYNPEEDAPADDTTLSILPTKEEIEGGAETLEFLVVGLTLTKNPTLYSTRNTDVARNKKRMLSVPQEELFPQREMC